MFPKWEFDVEDTPAENIIKLMFPAVVSPAKKKVVKEDSPRPQKKARKEASEEVSEEAAAVASEEATAEASEEVHTTVGGLTKEDVKTMFKEIVEAMREGFGMCLKEIKYLSERVEGVEKKVGITTKRKGTSAQNTTPPPKPTLKPGSESVNGTNAGRKSLPEDKGPDVPADASSSKDKAPEPSLVLLDKNQSTVSDLEKEDARYLEKRDAALALCRAKSDRTRKLAASQQSPYTTNSTAKVIIPNKKLYPGYNPFAPIDKKKLKELADCHYRTPLEKKPRTSRTWWYQILRTSLEWLEDCRIDAWINVLRKMYDANPQHFRSERMCFLDHLFAQQWRFNYKYFKDSESDQNGLGRRLPGGAWNYYLGTIPSFCQSNKKHIVVWDNICYIISPEELDVVMEPFLYMVPYLLVECASSDEQRAQYSLEPFTYERPTNIPPARACDCGVYTRKYIECHALGI
uniref:Ubiquitin-like protease family profile domain-containing protein n=1 Tax=Brassica oleracea var. oleracea TaxID=109376 RepID=A0A0D3ED42_BRAOL